MEIFTKWSVAESIQAEETINEKAIDDLLGPACADDLAEPRDDCQNSTGALLVGIALSTDGKRHQSFSKDHCMQ
jgi:hypothetical protein